MAIKTYVERYEEYQAAETAILSAQSYEINGRKVVRADLQWIQKEMARLYPLAMKEQSGRSGIRCRGVIPIES